MRFVFNEEERRLEIWQEYEDESGEYIVMYLTFEFLRDQLDKYGR